MIQLWKLISGEDISVFCFQPNIFEKNKERKKETFSLQTIADLSFVGCITNLIFYTLLLGKRAKSLFENLKKTI